MAACFSAMSKRPYNNTHLQSLSKALNSCWKPPHKLERIQSMSYRRRRYLQVSKVSTLQRAVSRSNETSITIVDTLKIKGSSSGGYYGFQEVANGPNVDSPFVTEVTSLEKEEGSRGVTNARFATSVIGSHLLKKLQFERILRYQTQRYGGEYQCFVLEAIVDKRKSAVYHAIVREPSPMKPDRELCCWSFMHNIPTSETRRSDTSVKQAKVNLNSCQKKKAEESSAAKPQTNKEVTEDIQLTAWDVVICILIGIPLVGGAMSSMIYLALRAIGILG